MSDDLTPDQRAILSLLDRVEALERRLAEIDKATCMDAYRRRLRASALGEPGRSSPALRVVGVSLRG